MGFGPSGVSTIVPAGKQENVDVGVGVSLGVAVGVYVGVSINNPVSGRPTHLRCAGISDPAKTGIVIKQNNKMIVFFIIISFFAAREKLPIT